ncbi:ABC-2 type transport system ATP-binding protein [Streptomyces sp. DSM 42143]|jgi:ABC-2 type transport system ATP-binding protein|uniref:ABC transporter ATP-binding protein n=1 Tax=Streptomyces TaxID=1883 RepID=UPI0025B4A4EE|nr:MULTISPECIES: ABC transporter ATP-binding protein [unclassified Streptomyces]MDN3244720.1 ABC transporter ATP-binding protein [Streptomyces sp. ZSW22]MDN3252700.1 ABC transporter ATP-binding protein [Streptomyces sp. MA25(2023)]MDQ0384402.1 ABC-2 type transport system ATP-binding protein [Streptomyces sp. DSM 42143]
MADSTRTTAPVLSVSRLDHRVSPDFALRSLTFSVHAGEGVAVIGTNGAGKTTLIRLVAGLLRPSGGEVRVCGTPPRRWGQVGRHIGYVQQAKDLPDGVSVETYVKHQLKLRRADPGRYEELIALADLEQYRHRYVRSLSGGSQRKLHVICAVAHRPDLLILDEPTTGLDPTARETLLELLGSLKKDGVGVLFASHHRDELVALADSVVVLHQGRQIQDASLDAVTRWGERSSLVLEAFTDAHLAPLHDWAGQQARTGGPIRCVRTDDRGVRLDLTGGDHRGTLAEVVARAHAAGLALRSASYFQPTLADVVRSIVDRVEPEDIA